MKTFLSDILNGLIALISGIVDMALSFFHAVMEFL